MPSPSAIAMIALGATCKASAICQSVDNLSVLRPFSISVK
jgi:hypothetical protein